MATVQEWVVGRAAIEARWLNHEYIGTEHLLLALLAVPGGMAAEVLHNLGTDPVKVSAEIHKIIMAGPATEGPVSEKLPRTPRAKQALLYAREEAAAAGFSEGSSVGMLLGLLREAEGVAAVVLTGMGVSREAVLAAIAVESTVAAVLPVKSGFAVFTRNDDGSRFAVRPRDVFSVCQDIQPSDRPAITHLVLRDWDVLIRESLDEALAIMAAAR